MWQAGRLKIIRNLFRYPLDLLLPKTCVLCASPLQLGAERNICSRCAENMIFIEAVVCRKCGLPSPSVGGKTAPVPTSLCGWCRKRKYVFDQARAIGLYQGNLKELIHLYKYNRMVHLAEDILGLVTGHFPDDFRDSGFDYLIPVPLHKTKLKEREYNQTAILAEKISAFLSVPVNSNILIRDRYTQPQVDLSGVERWRNVRNAFRLKEKISLEDKNLLLLDDVFTTGATINECARVLRKTNPSGINVLTIARAV